MLDQPVAYLIHCIVENGMQDIGYLTLDAQLSSIQHQVSSIKYKDIAAVVKEVNAEIADKLEFHEEELKSWLQTYQRTNIAISHHRTMLPLRFGIMVDHKEEVEDFLSTSYIHLKWALDRLTEKAEFAVQVSWDLNAVLQQISHEEQFKSEIENQKSKILMGRLLFKAADEKKRDVVEWVHSMLSGVSLDSSEGRSADEPIIMNRSYLIEKTAEELFDEAMAELAEEGESYLSVKYVGPMPPYSFAPLQFKLGNYELIDHARRQLALPERARFEDIKSSYRTLSLKHHPDKNSGDQRSAERFRQIDEAYKILEAYCSSYRWSPAFDVPEGIKNRKSKIKNAIYSFTKDDVEEVFVVERALVG